MTGKNVIVYTSGVFDLFHMGHLRMLQHAKGLGDRLIVGVSTDELAASYKAKQPRVTYHERAAIVGALRCVDVCIPQHDRDKVRLWEKLNFDVWVVGDDWFGDEYYMATRERLAAYGVRSVFLPYSKEVNSTSRRTALAAQA